MGIFRNIFGIKEKEGQKGDPTERNPFLPDPKQPLDLAFTLHFKANGGKFLYCETMDEVYANLAQIVHESNLEEGTVLFLKPKIDKLFKTFKPLSTNALADAKGLLTDCEYLIASNGSILLSSNQICQKKMNQLPDLLVVFAATSQIVENISEGLRGIKHKNKKNIPTNITTIKHFAQNDAHDFLNYGSSPKNVYLLLLEDL